jgi:hypothetical protein
MRTPAHSGILNNKFSAVADPIISARSVAAMATSATSQRKYTSHCRGQHIICKDGYRNVANLLLKYKELCMLPAGDLKAAGQHALGWRKQR